MSGYSRDVAINAYRLSVTGIVQGVGFRPFVYNLATRLGLTGWVLNHSGGVDIEVEGPPGSLAAFLAALRAEAPPLARIETLDAQPIPAPGYPRFEIRASTALAGRYQLLSPDVATCPDCLRELFDPADRRYRYPFINCTNCGPRFTIITDIPYDRPNTTMRAFPLCPACRREYEDPANRRFHAQPNACPVCGPHIWLHESASLRESESAGTEETLARAKTLLLSGKILAIKGLGGFLLACDATNAAAVERLRARKRRPAKPFAVMFPTLDDARAVCEVSPAEAELLTSPQAPIVLLDRLPITHYALRITDSVVPNQHTLGVMLPYTPLHHLLLRDVGRPLVMTSGNLSEEPIAGENEEALQRLGALADAFLFHNRDIHSRYDDSVVQVNKPASEAAILRRARGYAPTPLKLPFPVTPVLATGADLKNTFCLARDGYAFMSQHIGDMGALETLEHFEQTLALYRQLFRLEPERIACDLHPDYESTRVARAIAAGRELIPVQHHAAHIAACLVDNGWTLASGPVIGVALDGTGYGEDGAIWGGEWLVGDYSGFRRAARLEYLPLPGGDAAIHHPWRVALAYLDTLLGPEAYPAGLFCPGEAGALRQQLRRRLNTPLTSSMGRLFDAVSALLGVCAEATYEAQAALELEQLVPPGADAAPYPYDMEREGGVWVARLAPLLAALVEDFQRAAPAAAHCAAHCAGRFHATIAQLVVDICVRLRAETGLATVALSGGVWQNRRLLEMTLPRLIAEGFYVLTHHQVPCNDGGVALGQVALAAWGR